MNKHIHPGTGEIIWTTSKWGVGTKGQATRRVFSNVHARRKPTGPVQDSPDKEIGHIIRRATGFAVVLAGQENPWNEYARLYQAINSFFHWAPSA